MPALSLHRAQWEEADCHDSNASRTMNLSNAEAFSLTPQEDAFVFAIVVVVIVVAIQDSTSSRLLPGSRYSCCIRNFSCTCAQIVPPHRHHDST
jgi:hypothetical protein